MRKRILVGSALALAAALLVGCGGGGGGDAAAPASTDTVASVITPAKGIIYGGVVTAYSVDGKVLATGETGSLTSAAPGKATLQIPKSTTGAVLIKVAGGPATTYFDESTGRNVSGAKISLATAAASVSNVATVGVTPFTTMAAKLAGINPTTLGTSAYVAPAAVSAATLAEGASRTLLALGLPANINIFAVPTPPSLSNPVPSNDIIGAMLARIASSGGLDANTTFAALIDATPVSAVSASGGITAAPVTNTTAFANINNSLAASASVLGITVSAPSLAPTAATVQATVAATAAAVSAGTLVTAPPAVVPTAPVEEEEEATGTGTGTGTGSLSN